MEVRERNRQKVANNNTIVEEYNNGEVLNEKQTEIKQELELLVDAQMELAEKKIISHTISLLSNAKGFRERISLKKRKKNLKVECEYKKLTTFYTPFGLQKFINNKACRISARSFKKPTET